MTVSNKIRTIDNKIMEKKVPYNLDKQTAKFFCFIIQKCW